MNEHLIALADSFSGTSVLVLGDLILDEWIWGTVSRISPEAPIPVVDVDSVTYSPGGACNVASNIVALGGRPLLFGLLGDDHEARTLIGELQRRGVDPAGLVIDKTRPTTRKTRIVAHNQQVVRADRERRDPIGEQNLHELLDRCISALGEVGALLISDYAKGVTAPSFLRAIIGEARERGVPVIVDPKGVDYSKYRGVSCITPNQLEASLATHVEIRDVESLEAAGTALMNDVGCESVLITRGEHGIAVFEQGQPRLDLPALAREVYDVTGAGDTVVAALALARASGASWQDAARVANHAAGVVVGKVGTAVCTTSELVVSLQNAE